MLENVGRASAGTATPPPKSNAIEFYTVELAPLEGGMIGVSLLATTFDEKELELLCQELGASQAPTIDDALAFIKATVRLS